MTEVKLQLRLPADLRDWFAQVAAANDRSMNGQMIALLKQYRQQTSAAVEGTLALDARAN